MDSLTGSHDSSDTAARDAARRAAVRAFVRETFGLRGTLHLHRAAFGLDLLRAPVNVMLSPVYLLTRLGAGLARLIRLRRTAAWLAGRRILLSTRVSREVGQKVLSFLADLDRRQLGPAASVQVRDAAVADYVAVRNAVAEMTTAVLVLVSGLLIFHTATPGVMSLAGPVAEMQAHSAAVDRFPLGEGLGRLYYAAFPVHIPPGQVMLTFVLLAILSSVLTTFAGVLADPLQALSGTHRRRLLRLLRRLDSGSGEAIAREHLAARLGDATDMALSIWRSLRG
ncbi:DUF6635 family protein [Sulfitobacter sp. LCG007]